MPQLYLTVQNRSTRKRLYRKDDLLALAARILEGEQRLNPCEVSLVFCDDAFIRELNLEYRDEDCPTDVLSFPQDFPMPSLPEGAGMPPELLGDIIISLETVDRFHQGDLRRMKDEVLLLFCHGMLHLLGDDHPNKKRRAAMQAKQASYLGWPAGVAWPEDKH
jgi:probable rRNA maturation factor